MNRAEQIEKLVFLTRINEISRKVHVYKIRSAMMGTDKGGERTRCTVGDTG